MSSIRRSVQVMELLARKGPVGVRSVAQTLELPLGSAHRILRDLAEEAIVEKTPAGQWELSYRLLGIVGLHLERIQLPQLARPMLEKVADATGETVHLSAASGAETVCLDKVQTDGRMQLNTRIGSRAPMYCTGSGKAMLAFMMPEEQERILSALPLAPFTSHTITDPVVLRRDLERTRRRGFSLDHEEAVAGVHCIGVPILDHTGRAVGGISVSGTSTKAEGPELDVVAAMLREAASYVSRRLGFGGIFPGSGPVRGGAGKRPVEV